MHRRFSFLAFVVVSFLTHPLACLAAPSPELSLPSFVHAPILREQFVAEDELSNVLHALMGDDTAAFAGFTPQIIVADQFIPNAYARGTNTIVITRGLLESVKSADELAFIVAHELGHLMLHHADHPSHRLLGNSRISDLYNLEVEADSFACKLLVKSGFSSNAAIPFLERLGRWGAELGTALRDMHPTLSIRVERLRAENR